ncbi:MAG: class I SAM-dependent methyltransferase [Rubrobacter sp.]|nr:class I SAM-dependent methyltransferase [Rubrobacter sp.]
MYGPGPAMPEGRGGKASPPPVRRLLDAGDLLGGYVTSALERLICGRHHYETVGWGQALRDLEALYGREVEPILGERALLETEQGIRRLLREIRAEDPFLQRWAADSLLARACYLLCRLLRPAVVLETGVAYGVSSAFMLAALEENGRGELHSVDLPPLRPRAGRFWGIAVPGRMQNRWRLHRGASRRVLPGLLAELGEVDLFVHDSLHTLRNMRFEFGAVWPHLRPGGAVLADDVERNAAFEELRGRRPLLWRVVADREREPLHGPPAPVVFGLAVKASSPDGPSAGR